MANELRITAKLSFNKSSGKVTRGDTAFLDVTGDAFTHEIQSIGTTEEEIAQGADLGTPGYLWIKNLDSTNYVEVGTSTGVYQVKLLAGEFAQFRPNGTTIYGKANTSACLVEYVLVEA